MPRPPFRLVGDSADEGFHLASSTVAVVSAGEDRPATDAVVIEDDTFHVLSAEPSFRPVEEHPIRIMTAAWGIKPTSPGTVLVQNDRPLELLAVIYDLDASPPTRKEWITAALREILATCEQRDIRTLALPPPGLRCGGLSLQDSLGLLERSFRGNPFIGVRRLTLITESPKQAESLRSLLTDR